jgi:protein SCO1/2
MMIRFTKVLLVAVLALAGCGAAATGTPTPSFTSQLRGAVFDPPRTVADFSVPSSSGAPFTLSEYRGKIVLLYFGYLTCPDVCPTTLAELQNVYKHLNQPVDQVKVVFISVDPERDTLDNLTKYAHAFSPDFIAARTDGSALKQVMGEFGVTATKRQVGDSPLSYLVDHTASVFLVAPDGRLLEQYLYGTDYRDIVYDIQAILQAA